MSERERTEDLAHEIVRELCEEPTDSQETEVIEMLKDAGHENLYVGDPPWMARAVSAWIENNRDRILAALGEREREPVAYIDVEDGVMAGVQKVGPTPPDGRYALVLHDTPSSSEGSEQKRMRVYRCPWAECDHTWETTLRRPLL